MSQVGLVTFGPNITTTSTYYKNAALMIACYCIKANK